MQYGTLYRLGLLIALAACGGGAGLGERCANTDNCSGDLQCLNQECVPRCDRAPNDCGDGYSCDGDRLCRLATGQLGDRCDSEVDCAPGLTCRLGGVDPVKHELIAHCANADGQHLDPETKPLSERLPAGASCTADEDCRNPTCALGRCVDLCQDNRDCLYGTGCMAIPRIESDGKLFKGCLLSKGNLSFEIPMQSPNDSVLLPVPSGAHSATLVFSVSDPDERVGAERLVSPEPTAPASDSARVLYVKPCDPGFGDCTDEVSDTQFFSNLVRHRPLAGLSVLAMPSSPEVPLKTGAYSIRVSSFKPDGSIGSSIPRIRAVVRNYAASVLDLHFYFLNLDDHPCAAHAGVTRFDADYARSGDTLFRTEYLADLHRIFEANEITIDEITYENKRDHPALDSLDVRQAGQLLRLGKYSTGINVFFVRSLSPVGIQAFGPNPGPAGIAGTPQSGIIIAFDSLCQKTWRDVARLTAYEIARYMGLYHNIERASPAATQQQWRDPIADSDDSSANLMYYSESGGTELSNGQREILRRSGVLR